ncbi:MAG: hypothetical protein C0504_05810 [Candidatus Solibacter sp.]|nr:hypothetical protein [Candidatus Solibacter sp.]
MFKDRSLRFAINFIFCLALMSAAAVYAQGPGSELPPSNLDPPPQQAAQPHSEPAREAPKPEPPWSVFDYIDPSEPRFYAKLGLLLGSLLLARKAYRQMKPH